MLHINDMRKIWKLIFIVIIAVSVFAVFGLFIRNNNKRATSISIKSLKDATIQSGLQIDEILKSAQNEMGLLTALYEEILEDSEVHAEDLQKLAEETSFDYIEFANIHGIDLNSEGKTAEVSDRKYFQEGIKGNSGVEVVFDSKITDENLVIFYAPLHFHDEIIGVLTGSYRESKMQEIIYNTVFGEEARTFLCMRDGTVIASCNGGYISESIFDDGNFKSELASDVKEGLKEALSTGREYEFQYQGKSGTGNAYVTAIGESEWMLVQTYPSQVTSQFVHDANKAGIILLIQLIVIFVICLVITQIVGSIQRKMLILENKDKSYVVDGITQLFETFMLVDLEQGTYRYLEGLKPQEMGDSERGSYESMKNYIVSMVEDEDERTRLDHVFAKDELQRSLTDTPHLRYEYRTKRDRGKWDGVNLICVSRVDGIPSEILVAYSDVTKAKESELRSYEALKEAYQAVESANQAKSDFLSSMSHDIRTPMNAIMGMTAIAAMNIEKPDRVKDCLNKITTSSKHLLGLINEVLDMSKIESGKLSFTEEEFNLSDVIENIVTMFLPQTQAKHQNFNVNVSDIMNEEVIGDSMRLQQIFINILGNAVKFTQEGGNIHFGICEKTSGMHGYGCYVFTFEDSGIGMDEGFMEKMFEPFTRAQDSRTSKIEGTGLGMPIVKNLVQMMNGEIQVESKLNEGTKFIVTVYLKHNRYKQDDVEDLKNLSVLVADDDQFACESACSVLKEIGMKAEGVLSGKEAFDKIAAAHNEKNDYSAVILDWKMPDMDGVETTRMIRAKIGDEVPIIILSAFDYSVIEQEARDAGVDAFISKPLFRSRLVYIMKSLMFGEKKEHTEIDRLQSQNYFDKRVLLVEDNEINIEIAEELLTQAGVKVEKAMNGRLAVERVQEMPAGYYNLIFMDIQMPEMNGYEATSAIRASGREDLKTIPIIAMSADVFMDDVKHAQDVGMNGHVAKPIEIEKLLKALEEWVH